jgi:hypothetical protein
MFSPSLKDSIRIEEIDLDGDMGFFQNLWNDGLMFVMENPILAGAGAGVLGLVVLYVLRHPLFKVGKWVVSIPLALLSAVFSPLINVIRRRRVFRGSTEIRRHRLPMIGQMATFGPCRTCGTKREYDVKVTAYYGGRGRGIDTMTGQSVIGCADCTLS